MASKAAEAIIAIQEHFEVMDGKRHAGMTTKRLLGFWFVLHTMGEGDYDKLWQTGFFNRATVWRDRQAFRAAVGMDPLDYLPETAAALRRELGRAE